MGDVAFTDTEMVWTDSSNGAAGLVHVRDLASGAERSFDPQAGERCNLLGLGATGDRVVLSQYCGTYADGGRDDRVQVLTTDGDQVVTLQDDGMDGWLPAGERRRQRDRLRRDRREPDRHLRLRPRDRPVPADQRRGLPVGPRGSGRQRPAVLLAHPGQQPARGHLAGGRAALRKTLTRRRVSDGSAVVRLLSSGA